MCVSLWRLEFTITLTQYDCFLEIRFLSPQIFRTISELVDQYKRLKRRNTKKKGRQRNKVSIIVKQVISLSTPLCYLVLLLPFHSLSYLLGHWLSLIVRWSSGQTLLRIFFSLELLSFMIIYLSLFFSIFHVLPI